MRKKTNLPGPRDGQRLLGLCSRQGDIGVTDDLTARRDDVRLLVVPWQHLEVVGVDDGSKWYVGVGGSGVEPMCSI